VAVGGTWNEITVSQLDSDSLSPFHCDFGAIIWLSGMGEVDDNEKKCKIYI
jgi:hypothetical protein